jgi:formylmethanofuran dehydrogenase subunit E
MAGTTHLNIRHKMTSSYNFDALTDAFENLPLARRKWVREHWDEMMLNFACKMYDYVEAAVPDDEEEEEEVDVDDYDAPNIFPYKKCSACGERCSCGSYTTDKQWLCEQCLPEE